MSLDPSITADVDLYALLLVSKDASPNTLKKAYRKVALKYHPDKNPDDKDAASKFHFLSLALETLSTPALKEKYDRMREAQAERIAKKKRLGQRQREMKRDLEEREMRANETKERKRQEQWRLDELREEGLKRRKEMDSQVHTSDISSRHDDNLVVIKYRLTPGSNITEAHLNHILSSFGSIDLLRIKSSLSSTTRKSAIVIYNHRSAAQACSAFLSDPSDLFDQDAFYKMIKSVVYKSETVNVSKTATISMRVRAQATPRLDISIEEKLLALKALIREKEGGTVKA